MKPLSFITALTSLITATFTIATAQATELIQTIAYDKTHNHFYQMQANGSYQKIDGMPSINASKPVQIKVINVNKFKYKVTVKASELNTFTSIPAILNPLFAPSTNTKISSEKLISASSFADDPSRPLPAGVQPMANSMANSLKILEAKLTELQADLDRLTKLRQSEPELFYILTGTPDPKFDYEAYKQDPKKPGNSAWQLLKGDLNHYLAELRQGTQADPIRKIGELTAKQDPVSTESSLATIPEIANAIQNRIATTFNEVESTYNDIIDQGTQLRIKRNSAELANSENFRSLANNSDTLLAQIERKVQSARTAIEAAKASKTADARLFAKLNRIVNSALNEDAYEINCDPVSVRGDRVRFSITITPIEGAEVDAQLEAHSQNQPAQVDLDVAVVGKTKIDFSAGVFFTNLTDGSYRLDSGRIRRGATDKIADGFGGLLHIYKTSNSNLVPALSFGLMSGKGEPAYLAGASLILGNEQRFIFSAGFAFRRVDRLDGYSVGDTISATSIPTRKVFRSGMFFGITFNIGF